VALLVLLFPMLPAEGPGVPQPYKWTFTTVGDRQQVRPTPMPAMPSPRGTAIALSPPDTMPREVRLARVFARALLHRPATVSLVPMLAKAAAPDAIPTTWTPPDPAAPVAWEIRVSQGHHLLEVYRDSLRVMAFPVGLGANGSTPVGRFEITQKAVQPAYRRPDGGTIPGAAPDNPLGSRWMGLVVPGRTGIGIHGTPHLDSIGDDLSLGCIRMRNPDVEKLYQAIPAHVWVSIEP
ncbi:MAG TPA: L,D-transpeptidase, partial [Stenomitos sp.]